MNQSFDIQEMWKNSCLLTRLVAVSLNASESAGTIIKCVMTSGDLKIVDKNLDGLKKDLQTEADRSAQAAIEMKLISAFGNKLQIVGEEELPLSYSQTSQDEHRGFELSESMRKVLLVDKCVQEDLRSLNIEDLTVWVDPLDGTSEFVRAQNDPSLLEQVTVLIGITYKGRPIAGVIHQPYYNLLSDPKVGRSIWGIKGVGVFGINTCKESPPSGPFAVTTASHSNELVDTALKALQEKNLIREFRRVGGAGFKVLCCLEGAAAYVFASGGCKKWDTAAPEAVLTAAGGTLTDISGFPLLYEKNGQMQNSHGVLATASWINHQTFVSVIPQHVKDSLFQRG
uniref:3'(2'),5'-bisphosphate nucleotidase 1 n=1 Tax=Meloidogyne incognita TaxID=6306 RepID=A0A914M9Y6_MELIC